MVSRGIKRASLNEKELNEIWVKINEIYGNIQESPTIKLALKDAIEYDRIKKVLRRFGIHLEEFAESLKDV